MLSGDGPPNPNFPGGLMSHVDAQSRGSPDYMPPGKSRGPFDFFKPPNEKLLFDHQKREKTFDAVFQNGNLEQ